MDSALIQEDFGDFELRKDARSCWITVDNISVYIVRTDEGVSVDLYAAQRESDDALAGTWALHQEAATEKEIEMGMSDEDYVLPKICYTDRLPKCRSFG